MNASPRENLRKKFMERRKKAVSCKAQKGDELRPAMDLGQHSQGLMRGQITWRKDTHHNSFTASWSPELASPPSAQTAASLTPLGLPSRLLERKPTSPLSLFTHISVQAPSSIPSFSSDPIHSRNHYRTRRGMCHPRVM